MDVADGTSRNIGLPDKFQTPVGEFSRDGRRFTFVSVAGGMASHVDLVTGQRGPVRSFAGMLGARREESAGFAVSPDGSRVAVPLFPGGAWVVMSVLTGAQSDPFERPGDRLLTWTRDGLIWGRLTALGGVYSIRATDLNGRNARLLYRINLGYDGTRGTVLVARDLDVPQ